jgi:hypothetical protein
VTNFPLGVLARRTARPVPTVRRQQGVTALSMRIFTHSISPGRSRLERRRVQPPRSVQVRAEKLFQLDLINRQGTAACCAHQTVRNRRRADIAARGLGHRSGAESVPTIVASGRNGVPNEGRSGASPKSNRMATRARHSAGRSEAPFGAMQFMARQTDGRDFLRLPSRRVCVDSRKLKIFHHIRLLFVSSVPQGANRVRDSCRIESDEKCGYSGDRGSYGCDRITIILKNG